MKALNYLFRAILLLGFAASLTACPDKKSGGSNVVGGTQMACPAGQLYVPQYNGCFPINNCPAGFAFVQQVNQCLPGTAGGVTNLPGGAYTNKPTRYAVWDGRIQFTNPSLYTEVLKSWNVCDMGTIFWTWDIGVNNCHTWDDFANIRFEVQNYSGTGLATLPGPLARTTIIAANQYGSMLALEYPRAPYAEYLYPINGNTGFEMRSQGAHGTYGYNDSLSVIGAIPSVIQQDGTVVPTIRLQLKFSKDSGSFVDLGYADVKYVYGM